MNFCLRTGLRSAGITAQEFAEYWYFRYIKNRHVVCGVILNTGNSAINDVIKSSVRQSWPKARLTIYYGINHTTY